MSLKAGEQLGPYEILAPIGAGGMGEVYKARDTRLDRIVAIKALAPALAADPQFRERFDREARAISQLTHPHICTLHDVGRQEETEFLVLEYLDGETLAARLAKGTLPLEDALTIAVQIASALGAAHEAGIVHRDLKPGNVMLTRGGAKLLDFGLAKSGAPAAVGGASMLPTTPAALTAQGTILGTFQYMAPEQLEGREADSRTDIFAFGAVLYEMVTGKKAFDGSSQASLIAAIMSASPASIADVSPAAPPLLDRLVRACLAKDPADRLQSARDIVTSLGWTRETSVSPGHRSSDRRRPQPLALALMAALAAALGAGGTYLLTSRTIRPSSATVRFDLAPPAGTRFVNTHALSPDATRIVAVVSRDRTASLWLRRFDEDDWRPIAGTDGATYPFWSPDSQAVGFFADDKLKRVDTRSGSPIAIADAPAGRGGAWTDDGWIIFAPSNNDPLTRIRAGGGDLQPLTKVAVERGENSHRFPFLLSGGRFGYYAMNRNAAENGVWVASLSSPTAATRVVRSDASAQFGGAFLFFMRDNGLVAQRLDRSASALTGDPVTVGAALAAAANLAARPMSVSSDGSVAFRREARVQADLVSMSRTGGRLGAPLAQDVSGGPDLSADGRRIAFVKVVRGQGQLWVMDVVRQTATTIASAPALHLPRWSPDAQRMVFAAPLGPGGNNNLFDIPAAGGARRATVPEAVSNMMPSGWTHDGRQFVWIQFDVAPTGAVKAIGPDQHPKTLFEGVNIGSAMLSPDDRWIAYSSTQSGRPEVYVIGFPDAGPPHQVSTAGGTLPRWRGDGRELFYLSSDGKLMSVEVRAQGGALDLGPPTALFTVPVPEGFEYDVAPDGSRFVATSPTQVISAPLTIVLNWTAGLAK